MKKQYPYSNNIEFLSKLDVFHVREQWVKITLLEYRDETPIRDIEGEIIDGTLTKDGSSIIRRTCSLSCAVDSFKYNPDDIKSDYSISKKIYLELGITNNTTDYPDEKIIWFPQGVFFITSFSISSSANGATNISLEFKDKMAKLDGTIGGILPYVVRFDTTTTVENDVVTTTKALVYDIIMETVNHFGDEDISNIIIDDVPRKAKRIIRWMGAESLWIYPISNKGKISYDVCFTSDLDEKQGAHHPVLINNKYVGAKEYRTNEDIGYVYEDFVYDEELTFKAGSKVTDVLDKIKNWLGNYEYFYDEYGQFHFQEIKNYLNNSQSAHIWDKIQDTGDIDYLFESTHGKSIYTFDDNTNLISVTNTPSYENIKNDFIVEGTVTSKNNIKHTCLYHLVIDDKPTMTGGHNNVLIYVDPDTGNTTLATPKIIKPTLKNNKYVWSLPEFGESSRIYGLLEEPQTHTFKKVLKNVNEFETEYNSFVNKENKAINEDNNYSLSADTKTWLLALLEKYMGYNDNSTYKEQYKDVVFTLARQLRRYNVSKQVPLLSSTKRYYTTLYNNFVVGISSRGTSLSWCGGLLKLLYDLFAEIGNDPNDYNNFIDTEYWPAINKKIPNLWNGINIAGHTDSYIKLQRQSQCRQYINDVKIKQIQLKVLIEQYTQIINNYNVRISSLTKKKADTSAAIAAKKVIQNQINNFKEELEICGKRLTILYATLTMLGTPDATGGEVYYRINVSIPVYTSSFWYYDTDKKSNKYGWNELIWFKYYHNKTSPTSYYPNGLGSMTYINYSDIDWEEIEFDGNNRPSMNRYSSWYENNYIDYAKTHDLEYIDTDVVDDEYIPNSWRTQLLLMGLEAEANGTDPGHYYNELKANLPVVYNYKTGTLIASRVDFINYFNNANAVITSNNFSFSDSKAQAAADKAEFTIKAVAKIQDEMAKYENDHYYYFFDMIDSSSPIWGEYSVKNIGRRTNITSKDSINCIFAPEIPPFAFLNVSGKTIQKRRAEYAELADVAEDIIQVTDLYYSNFATGGFKQSAYEQIKYDLQQHTSYQNNISITAIPCFYLEPNTRVTLNDHATNTFGDYVIKSISIPLGIGNNMSVNLSKAMERI